MNKQILLIVVAVVLVLGLVAGALIAGNGKKQADSGLKKIGVLVFEGVLTSDITAPIEVFGAAALEKGFAYEVVTIAVGDKKDIKTYEGPALRAHYTIAENPQLDVLIVPGAYDLDALYANERLMSYLKEQGAKVSYLASNCAGAFLLGRAGLLKGRKATTWAGGEGELKKLYPRSLVQFDQNVVVDGKLITSNGGIVSYQAALIMLEKMSTPKIVAKVSEAIQYSRLARVERLKQVAGKGN